MKSENTWYEIENIEDVDSPALLIYSDRVKHNIDLAISMIGNASRLRPHVKTHKAKEPTLLMMKAGITKFKCATIAEAEMLGMCNAADVLLAYQPLGPKLNRFIALIKKYPDLVDLFYAHIGGMDMFARALITADNILNNSDYKKFRQERYASFDGGKGKEFEAGNLTLQDLRSFAIENGEPAIISGRQEYLENVINRFI